MSSGLKIACIGYGAWGKNLARNLAELEVLSHICVSRPESMTEPSARFPDVTVTTSYESILSDPTVSAVVIATPAATHAEFVRKALLADKDVFVEKPLCLRVDEGTDLVKLAQERKRVLMVGHLLWYHPAVLQLQSLIRSGALGKVHYIYSNRLNLGKIRTEENALWSLAPHDISVILGLMDEVPHEISGTSHSFVQPRIADSATVSLAFPSGAKAHVFVSWLHPFKEQRLVVVGEQKMAVFDDVAKTDKLVLYPYTIDRSSGTPVAVKGEAEPVALEQVEPLKAECMHFTECIKTRAVPRTDGAEALRVLQVLSALDR